MGRDRKIPSSRLVGQSHYEVEDWLELVSLPDVNELDLVYMPQRKNLPAVRTRLEGEDGCVELLGIAVYASYDNI